MTSNDGRASIQKKDTMLDILERGVVMVHCNPRSEGVLLPDSLSHDSVVRLNFAYGFQLPAFEVDEEAISAVLNFNGLRFHCVIPWDAIFAITAPEFGHEGRLWPGSAPEEVLDAFMETEGEVEDEDGLSGDVLALEPADPKSSRPFLQVIDGDNEPGAVDLGSTPHLPRKRPNLKVVK